MTPHFIHDLKRLGMTRVPVPRLAATTWLPHALALALLPDERPVLTGKIRTTGAEPQEFLVRVVALPAGWKAAPMSRTVGVEVGKTEAHFEIALDIPLGRRSPSQHVVELALTGKDTNVHRKVRVAFVDHVKHGDKIGLIAGNEDFLGPALKKAGVEFEPIPDVGRDLARFGVIWLGTQAHTLDAAKVSTHPLALHRYIKSGGVLVISQMNDDGWDPGYLPCHVELSDDNTTSGKIAAPDHPIFRTPNRITRADGIMSYDSILACDTPARILLTDNLGRPSIAEIPCGHGCVLLFEPSLERYYSGASSAASAARKQYCALFANIVAYVRRLAHTQ